MFRRLSRQVGFALSALLVAVPGTAMALPSEAPRPAGVGRIVAIGDLHGDCSAWRDIARAAGLIDTKDRWTGDKTTLVQLGDITDRGPDSLTIVRDLQRLKREASRAGGRVVVVVGNHEAMNVTGDLRYVSPGEYAAFANRGSTSLRASIYAANRVAIETAVLAHNPGLTKVQIQEAWMKATPLGMIEHQIAWGPTGELGRWVIGNPAVLKLGDTVFVHGGISANYATVSIDEINRRVAAALTADETAPTSIINDPWGPLWYRGLISRSKNVEDLPPAPPSGSTPAPPRPAIDQEIEMVLHAYRARRIVIGHTPTLSGISVLHDGKLIRIDTGISAYYGGTPTYLEIVGDEVTPHTVKRSGARCGK